MLVGDVECVCVEVYCYRCWILDSDDLSPLRSRCEGLPVVALTEWGRCRRPSLPLFPSFSSSFLLLTRTLASSPLKFCVFLLSVYLSLRCQSSSASSLAPLSFLHSTAPVRCVAQQTMEEPDELSPSATPQDLDGRPSKKQKRVTKAVSSPTANKDERRPRPHSRSSNNKTTRADPRPLSLLTPLPDSVTSEPLFHPTPHP